MEREYDEKTESELVSKTAIDTVSHGVHLVWLSDLALARRNECHSFKSFDLS